MFGKRRLSAMAAVVALATVAGALGGALATAGVMHFAGGASTASSNLALEASVARIDADHPGPEGRRRAHLQGRHRQGQQDQRPPRQGREGAGRTCRQTRQAQRSRREASGRAGSAGRRSPRTGRRQGRHRLDLAPGNGGGRRPRSAARAETRSGAAADGRGLGAARRLQWRRPDRGTAGQSSKSMPAIPSRASAASTPSASRTAAGWSSPARAWWSRASVDPERVSPRPRLRETVDARERVG